MKHLKEEQELEVSLEIPKEEETTEVTVDVSQEAEIPLDVSVQQEVETAAGFEVCSPHNFLDGRHCYAIIQVLFALRVLMFQCIIRDL